MSEEETPQSQRPEKERPEALLDRYGTDALKLAILLSEARDDRYKASERARKVEEKLEAFEQKVAKGSAVILEGDSLTRWRQYQEFGTPDDLAKLKAERDTYAESATKAERERTIRKVAQLTGWKEDVLADVAGNVPLAAREVEENGQKVEKAFVVRGEGDEVPAEQYFAKLLPALQPEQRRGDGVGTPARPQYQAPPTTPDTTPRIRL